MLNGGARAPRTDSRQRPEVLPLRAHPLCSWPCWCVWAPAVLWWPPPKPLRHHQSWRRQSLEQQRLQSPLWARLPLTHARLLASWRRAQARRYPVVGACEVDLVLAPPARQTRYRLSATAIRPAASNTSSSSLYSSLWLATCFHATATTRTQARSESVLSHIRERERERAIESDREREQIQTYSSAAARLA